MKGIYLVAFTALLALLTHFVWTPLVEQGAHDLRSRQQIFVQDVDYVRSRVAELKGHSQ